MSLLTGHHPGGTACPRGSPLVGHWRFGTVLVCSCPRQGWVLGGAEADPGVPWHCGSPNPGAQQ